MIATPAHVLVVVLVLVVTAAAAVTDARSGRIPNGLSLSLLAVVFSGDLVRGGTGAFLASLSGLVLCGAVPLFLFSRGAMGGGDVKLLAAIGSALGWARGLEVQITAYVAAALYAVAMLACRGELMRTLASAARLFVPVPRTGTVVPSDAEPPAVRLGVFVLLGCVLVVARSALGLS
jgi:prepilin peptidase CpaA